MARHAHTVDPRRRTTRVATLAVVWAAGLAAGFCGLLGCAARFGCGSDDGGLACGNGGSALGSLLVLAVIVVVTAVTLSTADRPPRHVLLTGAAGVLLLAACFAVGRGLVASA